MRISNKIKRDFFFVLSLAFTLIIPIQICIDTFDLVAAFQQAPSKVKVSVLALIILLIIVVSNMPKIKSYIKEPPFSAFKTLLGGILKAVPFIVIAYLISNLKGFITNSDTVETYNKLEHVVFSFAICNLISIFLLEPLYIYFSNEYKYDYEHQQRAKRGE